MRRTEYYKRELNTTEGDWMLCQIKYFKEEPNAMERDRILYKGIEYCVRRLNTVWKEPNPIWRDRILGTGVNKCVRSKITWGEPNTMENDWQRRKSVKYHIIGSNTKSGNQIESIEYSVKRVQYCMKGFGSPGTYVGGSDTDAATPTSTTFCMYEGSNTKWQVTVKGYKWNASNKHQN